MQKEIQIIAFGYAANKDKQPAVSSKVETPVKPEEKVQSPV